MNNAVIFILILFLSVFISAVSQILLKKSADKTYSSVIKEYLNVRVISAYALFGTAVILDIIALKRVPLSFVPIIESSSYIFVIILGKIFLKENFSAKKIISMIIIFTGILVFIL